MYLAAMTPPKGLNPWLMGHELPNPWVGLDKNIFLNAYLQSLLQISLAAHMVWLGDLEDIFSFWNNLLLQ